MELHKPALAVLAALTISTSALAERTKVEAVITKVEGQTITARTVNGPITVVLTPSTSIAQTSGIASKKARAPHNLIPGLIFTVDGDQNGQTITANAIRFKEKDWRTAVATKAGTQEQFSELRKAIIEGQEYVIREEATVYFPTGSAVIGASYKERLSERRAKAVSNLLRQTGYIQPGRVLSPSAMGQDTTAPGEAAPTSHDEARRVVVRVVTPKTQLTQ